MRRVVIALLSSFVLGAVAQAQEVAPRAPNPSAELRAFGAAAMCRRAVRDVDSVLVTLQEMQAEPEPVATSDAARTWMLPGDTAFTLMADGECAVGALTADPVLLRETFRTRLAAMPGVTPADATGIPLQNWAAIDLWCARDEYGAFAMLLSTAPAGADGLPGVVRVRRVEGDNQRCPAAGAGN
jgi:hypothetical protein